MRSRQFFKAAGYMAALLPMALAIIGVAVGMTWLAAVFFFVLLPIVRPLIGNDGETAIKKNEAGNMLRKYLIWLPRVYALAWLPTLAWSISVLAQGSLGAISLVGFFVSIWVVNSLNMCVAHELIHGGSKIDKVLGRVLAATAGYFHFADEHRSHHVTNGSDAYADSAPTTMSVYEYAYRRYMGTFRSAWEWEIASQMRSRRPRIQNKVIWTVVITLAVMLAHVIAAGAIGGLFFLGQVLAAAFSVQGITFLQHWGMRESANVGFKPYGFAWEDSCAMQACVTLNHAFHSHHHMRPGLRYFELQGMRNSPTLPASYPVMFLVALWPGTFRKLMVKQLRRWEQGERNAIASEKAGVCSNPSEIKAMLRSEME
jgi:alkane 1-monooxygenase